jgi:hypothetical protein
MPSLQVLPPAISLVLRRPSGMTSSPAPGCQRTSLAGNAPPATRRPRRRDPDRARVPLPKGRGVARPPTWTAPHDARGRAPYRLGAPPGPGKPGSGTSYSPRPEGRGFRVASPASVIEVVDRRDYASRLDRRTGRERAARLRCERPSTAPRRRLRAFVRLVPIPSVAQCPRPKSRAGPRPEHPRRARRPLARRTAPSILDDRPAKPDRRRIPRPPRPEPKLRAVGDEPRVASSAHTRERAWAR